MYNVNSNYSIGSYYRHPRSEADYFIYDDKACDSPAAPCSLEVV